MGAIEVTYRSSELVPHASKPRTPFLWGIRVWWASLSFGSTSGATWSFKFTDVGGDSQVLEVQWSSLASSVEAWERTPVGEPCAIRGNVTKGGLPAAWLITATQVPTLIRLARQAADAWERSK